jgi:neutral ceramidase
VTGAREEQAGAESFRAGGARLSVEPPLGLPMIGFVRRHQPAQASAGDLEVTVAAFERGTTRALVIGVDTLGIQGEEADALRGRVAAATGADPAAVLLNWNHTHCAPPGGRSLLRLCGTIEGESRDASLAYVGFLHEQVIAAARLAVSRLEEARVTWGLGSCDLAVNRRERTAEGRVILGWNEDGIVDRQVPVLQAQRRDGSAIATVVGYGCHTVAVGPDVLAYSADYPGPLRDAVRDWTGGECVYLQGAAGNVLPRVGFATDFAPAAEMGRRLALAALGALAGRDAWATEHARIADGSVTPISRYERRVLPSPLPALEAVELDVELPLLPLPTAQEIAALRADADAALDAAVAAGAGPGEVNVLRYETTWAQMTEQAIQDGSARQAVSGPVHALRIGDGAIVTGPGEIFSEIGMAVRERSPAAVTLYAGYTNDIITYFAAASAYPHGGYEPGYGNRSFGLPAQVTPECDGRLVAAGLDALAQLFPDAPPRAAGDDLLAAGRPLQPPPTPTASPSR